LSQVSNKNFDPLLKYGVLYSREKLEKEELLLLFLSLLFLFANMNQHRKRERGRTAYDLEESVSPL
jgi:hypothetical protein